ncbi:MAG: hypothetical protein AAGB16_07225 [Pseudomonadota bacterium]
MTHSVSPESLRANLEAFDGKSVTILSELNARYDLIAETTHYLIELFDDADENIQRGSTWIMLERIKSGTKLSDDNWSALAKRISNITDWQAALHVLQCLSQQSCPRDLAVIFSDFTNRYLDHERPFLRAWSISALHTLSQSNPDLVEAAKRAVETGHLDQAASVRARLRHLT